MITCQAVITFTLGARLAKHHLKLVNPAPDCSGNIHATPTLTTFTATPTTATFTTTPTTTMIPTTPETTEMTSTPSTRTITTETTNKIGITAMTYSVVNETVDGNGIYFFKLY